MYFWCWFGFVFVWCWCQGYVSFRKRVLQYFGFFFVVLGVECQWVEYDFSVNECFDVGFFGCFVEMWCIEDVVVVQQGDGGQFEFCGVFDEIFRL